MDKKKGINIEIIIVIEGDLITRHPNTLCIHHSRFLGVYLLKLRVTEETVRQTVFRSLLRVCLGNNDCPPAALRRDSVRERKSTSVFLLKFISTILGFSLKIDAIVLSYVAIKIDNFCVNIK